MNLDPLLVLLLKFLGQTNKPIFLTGKAGTGKTTFLHYLKTNLSKNYAVVAPTAVAAINAGGVTINSFFQMPFGPFLPNDSNAIPSSRPVSQEKMKLLQCLDLLIIDEISMVRADTLDYIDTTLRQTRGSIRPFGGVQLLMIGDLYQLPPVYQNDWTVLKNLYKGPYFFDSLVLKKMSLTTFELTQVYRQKDPVFIDILNSIRNGHVESEMLANLNANYNPSLNTNWLTDYVTLSTHNQLVNDINRLRLDELITTAYTFKATITGDFQKESYPTEEELVLKKGAQVMFIKNDSSGKKQYYNGRTARVTTIDQERIRLTFLDDKTEFDVVPEIWQSVKYSLSESEKKVTESNAGSFTQYPLKLAWAITIHKSQGLSFDKAIIDVDAAFAHGQTYVALSRCRTLEGLMLKSPVRPENISTDPLIVHFMKNAVRAIPDETLLDEATIELERDVLADVFNFSVLKDAWLAVRQFIVESESSEHKIREQVLKVDLLIKNGIAKIGKQFINQEIIVIPKEENIWYSEVIISRIRKAASFFLPKLLEFRGLFCLLVNIFLQPE
jgi:GTPase SAR1 family protein